LLVACEPAAPSQPVEPIAAPVLEVRAPVETTVPAVRVDAALVDRYPSLAYYPDLGEGLAPALAKGEPREILLKVAEGLVVYRWPSMLDWDRHGFIDIDGARPGFVTRAGGGLISQPADRHDLGCAGGFLEGVRMVFVPDLPVGELDRCDTNSGAAAVVGGPVECEPQRDYGWLALRNIAARLRPAQLPEGRRLFEIAPERGASLDPLAVPGAIQLCTVSHESAARDNIRFYHHLMIVLATADADALEVFDTTGIRGVALTRMTRGRLLHYVTMQLAANREYRYTPRSARLTCLPVATG
jgi:hypothetical protein